MRLVVSKQNPLSEKDKVAPADYKDEDFILLSHDMLEKKADGHVDAGSYRGSSCGRNFLDAGCASNGQKKRRRSHYGPISCYQCE